MTANNWSFETKQIHAGYDLDPATGATALPIYQTSSYAFEDRRACGGGGVRRLAVMVESVMKTQVFAR